MEIVHAILNTFSQYPDFSAGCIGISASILATQFIKRLLPDEWPERKYRKVVQIIGFVTGWFFSHGAWIIIDPSSTHFEKLYASMGCGFASPSVYAFVFGWLGHKFPWFDAAFSGRPNSGDANGSDPPK